MIVLDSQPFGFVYTAYDESTSLFVRAAIYDITGAPAFVANVVMSNVVRGTYSGIYTGTTGVTYLVEMAVYTDGTYATPDPLRSPGSLTVQCVTVSGGGSITLVKTIGTVQGEIRTLTVEGQLAKC